MEIRHTHPRYRCAEDRLKRLREIQRRCAEQIGAAPKSKETVGR